MRQSLGAFRLGDIRGLYPDEIDEGFVEQFAHAFVGYFELSGQIAVGHDMRESSLPLHDALTRALASLGIEVVDIGLCPTELGYFASSVAGISAAIVITASHNPARYNGLKCVLQNGRSITFDSGLSEIMQLMLEDYRHPNRGGSITQVDFHSLYLDFLKTQFPFELLRGGKIALNGLNGTAVTMASRIASAFDLPVTWFRKVPGPIPSQGADPVNPRLANQMREFMQEDDFTLGVAWDGDCDRCVCFDSKGQLIPTYYLVGLLTDNFLKAYPGAAIVFDTKLCWNTLDIIREHGGKAVASETGHAFMKQKMHKHRAVYGGELSSHHYFGNFFGCDSGMFAWLTVLKLLRDRNLSIRTLVEERRSEVCSTPEITMVLTDINQAFDEARARFGKHAIDVDLFDGLGFSMPGNWRFTLRRSKTEPVVRINFEARKSGDLLLDESAKVLKFFETWRGDNEDWASGIRIQ